MFPNELPRRKRTGYPSESLLYTDAASREELTLKQIKIIKEKISQSELKQFFGNPFADMIKFVVDIEKGIIALGGELHADAEEILIENGSKQENVWGGNIYPLKQGDDRIEYTSLINIRPSLQNFDMVIANEQVRNKVKEIVEKLLL